ncbi:GtrA family protein [Paraburkholderia sp. BL21I4N1]|uniref:GtrA family protein n=1 Tax=Paraburkholderia sp. BL21I4N1 TaxID=1938801 RepID=UPI000CFCB56E|nr:GtrA family protein [Paraburkholderia sp. BL21I4N1]PQV52516.1 putative flippase GtrA [Paraburkholderia sp. BL21I4N1]
MLNKLKAAFTGDRETRKKMLRYLLVGGLNTAFGYFATVGLYYALRPHLHIVVIGVIANVICITESFITYKLFVFNSREPWLREYLRCYVVYGSSALIGIAGLWLLVNILGIPFWLAQGLLMSVSVAISYAGHDRFTFKKAQRG